MKIKLKGVCIDIKKERSIKKLQKLVEICKLEQVSCKLPKREFLQIIINMIHTRIDLVLIKKPALVIV
tara:strand:- start:247 stop:450 length:204 start_codon:yes stop_codon:yes gene_type:complete